MKNIKQKVLKEMKEDEWFVKIGDRTLCREAIDLTLAEVGKTIDRVKKKDTSMVFDYLDVKELRKELSK